jgi:hypothetical protein
MVSASSSVEGGRLFTSGLGLRSESSVEPRDMRYNMVANTEI